MPHLPSFHEKKIWRIYACKAVPIEANLVHVKWMFYRIMARKIPTKLLTS